MRNSLSISSVYEVIMHEKMVPLEEALGKRRNVFRTHWDIYDEAFFAKIAILAKTHHRRNSAGF